MRKISPVWDIDYLEFENAVKISTNYHELARILNLTTSCGMIKTIKKRIESDGILVNHISVGKGHSKGKIFTKKDYTKITHKTCTICNIEQNIENFAIKNKTGLRSSCCKICFNKIRKVYYDSHKAEEHERCRKQQRQISDKITEIKKQSSCSKCGESHIACLHFHHLDPNEKEYMIAHIHRTGRSFDRIQKELDKCIILCANCHAKEHYNLRNQS